MNTLIQSHEFASWLAGLKDLGGRARSVDRLVRAEGGNFGDCKVIGNGISEMRIHHGPGYRVYQLPTETPMTNLTRFDVTEYLDSEEMVAEYLSVAMEDPDPDHFLQAIAAVARARGITQLAKDAGVSRESLYKTLAPGAKPRYETVFKLMHALGVQFKVEAAH